MNWEYMIRNKMKNADDIQCQMNLLFDSELTQPADESNYIYLVQSLQMIIFYFEYCNHCLNQTTQEVNTQMKMADKQIVELESKLTSSKTYIEKQKKVVKKLKSMSKPKQEEELIFQCLHCPQLEFKHYTQLDRHLEDNHKRKQNIVPYLIQMNQQLQMQMAQIQDMTHKKRLYQLYQQDRKAAQQADMERDAQFTLEDNLREIQEKYDKNVKEIEQLLKTLSQQDQMMNQQAIQQKEFAEKYEEALKKAMEEQRISKMKLEEIKKQLSSEDEDSRSTIMKYRSSQSQSMVMEQQQQQYQQQGQQVQQEQQVLQVLSGQKVQVQQDHQVQSVQQQKNILGDLLEYPKEKDEVRVEPKQKQKKSKKKEELLKKQIAESQDKVKKMESYIRAYSGFQKDVKELLYNRCYKNFVSTEEMNQRQDLKEEITNKIENEFDQNYDIEEVHLLEEELQKLEIQNEDYWRRKKLDVVDEQPQSDQLPPSEDSNSEEDQDQQEQNMIELMKHQPKSWNEPLKQFPFKILESKQERIPTEEDQVGYGVNNFSVNF